MSTLYQVVVNTCGKLPLTHSYFYLAYSNFNRYIIKQYCSCTVHSAAISLYQKLVDVQQTLIKTSNPLKRARFQIHEN